MRSKGQFRDKCLDFFGEPEHANEGSSPVVPVVIPITTQWNSVLYSVKSPKFGGGGGLRLSISEQ